MSAAPPTVSVLLLFGFGNRALGGDTFMNVSNKRCQKWTLYICGQRKRKATTIIYGSFGVGGLVVKGEMVTKLLRFAIRTCKERA